MKLFFPPKKAHDFIFTSDPFNSRLSNELLSMLIVFTNKRGQSLRDVKPRAFDVGMRRQSNAPQIFIEMMITCETCEPHANYMRIEIT